MKYIDYFNEHPTQKKILLFLSSFCVLLTVIGYILTLAYLFFVGKRMDLIKTIGIPLGTIIAIQLIRHIYSRPRPFEKYEFVPLIEHSKGKSFPSKHAASALVIAISIYRIFPLMGVLYIINALIVGLTRILSGIHYPSDILGGYLLAIIMSLFYFI